MNGQTNGKHSAPASASGLSPSPGPADVLRGAPALGAHAALALLVRLAPLHCASLWARNAVGEAACIASVGESSTSRGARQLAGALLAGAKPEDGRHRRLLGVALGKREAVLGVLIARAQAGSHDRCATLLAEAAPRLYAALGRDLQAAERAACERGLLASAERKLTRLGLDLHDGPSQEIAALASDVHLFAAQLVHALGEGPQRDLLRGRVEDIDAQLLALDRSLRRIAGEVEAPRATQRRELRASLAEQVHSFAERTGIKPRLSLAGPLGALSDSQQIALENIVAEALSNVRRHAQARSVEVAVAARREGVEATISDDGRGFQTAARSKRAVREGRKGLLAMHERVRLLGGQCVIESRPGGPTRVRVTLPQWQPLAQRGARRRRQAAASTARNGASSFSSA
ncbi:MAG TPA: ATP-binding protein [Solirubrobacteraceae bacterium]|jgi:signal transduction histidine kinase|nr:ATP-binding protein [Solirubrobacteraceae bacterium]